MKKKVGTKRKSSSLKSIEDRIKNLVKSLPKRSKSPKLSSYKSHKLKDLSFPSIPIFEKSRSRSRSRSRKNNCSCNCTKLKEMQKKYKQGQKILDQVDKYMGKI